MRASAGVEDGDRKGRRSFLVYNVYNIVYNFPVNSKEFKHWLTQQGATFQLGLK